MLSLEPIVFSELPCHDTCWSLIGGVDGKLYIGVCGEMTIEIKPPDIGEPRANVDRRRSDHSSGRTF